MLEKQPSAQIVPQTTIEVRKTKISVRRHPQRMCKTSKHEETKTSWEEKCKKRIRQVKTAWLLPKRNSGSFAMHSIHFSQLLPQSAFSQRYFKQLAAVKAADE